MDMSQERSYARIYKENAARQMDRETAAHTLREHAQSKCTWTCHKTHLTRELPRGVPRQMDPETAAHALSELGRSKCTWTCHKSHLMRELTSKMRHATWIPRPRPTLSASVRSRNAHGHVTRAILCENLQVKCGAPHGSRDRGPHFPRACAVERHMDMSQEPSYARITREMPCQMDPPTLCASVRNRDAHGHVTTAMLCENYEMTCGRPGSQDRDPQCVRACAIATHMNTNFMQQISMKNAGKRIEHSDQAPVFTPTIRTLQCGHAVWGKIDVNET